VASPFDFLREQPQISSTEVENQSSLPVPLVEGVPPVSSTTRTSSFGFLSSDNTVSTMSRDDSPVPSLEAATDLLPTTTTTTFSNPTTTAATAGVGITFGTGTATAKKVIKKRTRTAKIGAANNPLAASLPPPSAVPPQKTPEPLLQAASRANQRAEEFLSSRIIEEAKNADQPPPGTAKTGAPTAPSFKSSTSTSALPEIRSVPSEEDEVIMAAKAAAMEAHKIEAQMLHSSSRSSTFGGLFRARKNSSPPTSRPSIASAASSHSVNSDPVSSGIDRIQKESQDTKRAIAERQLQMIQQQEQPKSEPQESSPVKVPATAPTTAGSYKVPEPAPIRHAPPVASPHRSFRVNHTASAVPEKRMVDVFSAPRPKTPMEEFHEMMDMFQTHVVAAMEEVTRLRQHRSGLLEERFVTMAKERLAIQQQAQAEKHQMAAAESEDFEMADEMSNIIERHKREQAEYSSILENITRALHQIDQQKQMCVEQVTKCFKDIQVKLSEFQKQQEATDTKDATEALKKFSEASRQLSAENERLQQDWKHLERDAKLIADERRELEKAISEQSGEYEKLRDQARTKLADVEQEIEDLRQQLQAKQAVAAELRTEAAGHEESILKVRVKFSRQLTRIQKKEMTVKDNQEEWELEKKSFDRQKDEHEKQVNEHSEALVSRDKLLETLSKQVEMADTFSSIVAKEIGFDVSGENDEDDELAQMQANVVKCEAAVTESKVALKAVSAALHNLEEEVKYLEAQLPKLEDMKKAAAASRDFKAAGKASKEIKEATARIAECHEELNGDASVRKAAAEKELAKLELEMEEAREVARAKERESSVAAMKRLADNIKRLVATKSSVCTSAEERTIPAVGAFVLDKQIKALKIEGQTFGNKFGGWEELMAEIGQEFFDSPGAGNRVDSPAQKPSSNEEVPAAPSIPADDEQNTGNVPCNDDGSREERMGIFRDLTKKLKVVENDLEIAIANDDFEKAAELDEVLQKLLADVESLNMTDEEMELALSDGAADTTDAQSEEKKEKGEMGQSETPGESIEEIENVTTGISKDTEANGCTEDYALNSEEDGCSIGHTNEEMAADNRVEMSNSAPDDQVQEANDDPPIIDPQENVS
jgi:predicted  nucleic acid-binding Zn-ribbon protein